MVSASAGCVCLLADVGGAEDSQAFSVCRHQAVFNAVVDHFHEVPGAVRATMEIALLGRAAHLLAAGRFRNAALPRSERREDWLEVLAPPPPRRRSSCSSPVPVPIRLRSCPRLRNGSSATPVPSRGGCHPRSTSSRRRSRCLPAAEAARGRPMVSSTTAAGTINQTARGGVSFATKSASDVDPTAFSLANSATDLWRHVEHHAFVPFSDDAPHHVGAHPSQTNHSQLHFCSPHAKSQPRKAALPHRMVATADSRDSATANSRFPWCTPCANPAGLRMRNLSVPSPMFVTGTRASAERIGRCLPHFPGF